jgi:hypothetical protein
MSGGTKRQYDRALGTTSLGPKPAASSGGSGAIVLSNSADSSAPSSAGPIMTKSAPVLRSAAISAAVGSSALPTPSAGSAAGPHLG